MTSLLLIAPSSGKMLRYFYHASVFIVLVCPNHAVGLDLSIDMQLQIKQNEGGQTWDTPGKTARTNMQH
jgi:hypothetical protein